MAFYLGNAGKSEAIMNFYEAVKICYSKFFDFSGRASRAEFWYFRLFLLLASAGANVIIKLFADALSTHQVSVFLVAFSLLIIIPDLSVQVRRLQDRNISGLWLLPIYILIPGAFLSVFYLNSQAGRQLSKAQEEGFIMLGLIWVLWLTGIMIIDMLPGTKGSNRYGSDPLTSEPKDSATNYTSTSIFNDTNEQSSFSSPSVAEAKQSSRQNLSQPTEFEQQAALILLEHDDHLKKVFNDLAGVPKEIRDRIIFAVANDPSADINALRNSILLESLGRPDMNWDDELELIIIKCRDARPEDVTELFRVFPILSKRMPPMEVFRKIISEKKTEFFVSGAGGKKIKVTQHGTKRFSMESYSGTKAFTSLDELYEFLGTPQIERKTTEHKAGRPA
jgi:uncharacterized membrane protein YhaH (DUF805 family)